MPDRQPHRQARWPIALGIAAIAAGLICNEWLLTKLFSADDRISPNKRIVIWAFTVTAVTTGLALIAWRRQADRWARHTASRHPGLTATALGTLLALALLFGTEALFWTLNRARTGAPETVIYRPPSFRPGSQTTDSLRVGSQTIYDVTYTLDEEYRRVVPDNPPDLVLTHVYFFGGSFTFGQGVNDHESLANYLVQETDGVKAYNCGFPGHGPAHMLLRLNQMQPQEIPRQADAIGLYLFIPNHVKRTIGAMRLATAGGRDYPYYKPGPGGTLVHTGTFTTGRPILSRVYKLLQHEQILRYFGADLPTRITDKHLAFTTRVIAQSKRRFEELFGSDRFHVVLYPMHPNFEFNPQRLIPFLEQAGIDYFDYTQSIDLNQEGFLLEHDLHPTKKTHQALAQQLAADLALP